MSWQSETARAAFNGMNLGIPQLYPERVYLMLQKLSTRPISVEILILMQGACLTMHCEAGFS